MSNIDLLSIVSGGFIYGFQALVQSLHLQLKETAGAGIKTSDTLSRPHKLWVASEGERSQKLNSDPLEGGEQNHGLWLLSEPQPGGLLGSSIFHYLLPAKHSQLDVKSISTYM